MLPAGGAASRHEVHDRVFGIWGPAAYGWSGEERPRAAGFPIDPSGRHRVLGFPPDPFGPADLDWLRRLAHAIRRHQRSPESARTR
jgi:hypothetical protein